MASVYASLVTKDKKKFSEIPKKIQEEVRQILVKWGREDLAVE